MVRCFHVIFCGTAMNNDGAIENFVQGCPQFEIPKGRSFVVSVEGSICECPGSEHFVTKQKGEQSGARTECLGGKGSKQVRIDSGSYKRRPSKTIYP